MLQPPFAHRSPRHPPKCLTHTHRGVIPLVDSTGHSSAFRAILPQNAATTPTPTPEARSLSLRPSRIPAQQSCRAASCLSDRALSKGKPSRSSSRCQAICKIRSHFPAVAKKVAQCLPCVASGKTSSHGSRVPPPTEPVSCQSRRRSRCSQGQGVSYEPGGR